VERAFGLADAAGPLPTAAKRVAGWETTRKGCPISSEQDPGTRQPHGKLRELLDQLEDELATRVFTHASWTARRSDSYERLAFLGDSVLALAVTAHLYPRLEADRFGAGRLTKIRAQAVSGRSCRAVAERIGVPERLREAAPASAGSNVRALIGTERVLASVIEAVIGACYLEFGYERTAQAVVEAFAPEIDDALEHPVDFKSALQERLARRGELVSYDVVDEQGPPHDRVYSISATIDGVEVGRGTGRSKKDAEQEAAQAALDAVD
jgi:ribonuclease-3